MLPNTYLARLSGRFTCVTGGMIKFEAMILANKRKFAASNWWFTRYLRRRKLVVRRIASIGRDVPVNLFLKFHFLKYN